MSDTPRFVADVMLGSLATWLRILGFDTLYCNRIDDRTLLRIAAQEQRILLTRDTGIPSRRGNSTVALIRAEEVFEQLAEVLAFLRQSARLPSLPLPARCPRCNGTLEPASREAVAESVPEHVLLSADSFFRCRECGKVYWEGSHANRIKSKLKEVIAQWGASDGD
ncbi:MAG: Mut7-C RNAse domain-containing protein [Nitrospirota bacterium]